MSEHFCKQLMKFYKLNLLYSLSRHYYYLSDPNSNNKIPFDKVLLTSILAGLLSPILIFNNINQDIKYIKYKKIPSYYSMD